MAKEKAEEKLSLTEQAQEILRIAEEVECRVITFS